MLFRSDNCDHTPTTPATYVFETHSGMGPMLLHTSFDPFTARAAGSGAAGYIFSIHSTIPDWATGITLSSEGKAFELD